MKHVCIYELEVKYKNSPKRFGKISRREKKLNCPEE